MNHAAFEFITGHEWKSLSSSEREQYLDSAVRYWRKRGFPHYELNHETIRTQFRRLRSVSAQAVFQANNELQTIYVGNSLANYFHPQMWSVPFARHRTPLECFDDDELLRACLRRAFTISPNRRGASPPILRDMLRTFRHTRRVSNFRPAVAKALVERYSSPGDKVLDFSAGYGGRLLGCIAADRAYMGFDPCALQIRGLERTVSTLSDLGLLDSSVELRQVCAEDALQDENPMSYSLILTSPPYFNLEKYSNERSQSYIRYPTYERWRESFLFKVIHESYRLLRPGGYLILNVNDISGAPVATDTLRFARASFDLQATYYLRLSVLPYNRTHVAHTYRSEPVFVFMKRDDL